MSGRILVVEDDPLNAKFVECLLVRKGNFEVVMTENVDQILHLAKTEKVELVITDVSIAHSYHQDKEVDGIAITKLLKEDP